MIAKTKTLPIAQNGIDFNYIEENFKEYFPTSVTLSYVHYDDNLDYCMSQVEDAIEQNDLLDLENYVFESFDEQRWYQEDYYWNEFKADVLDELRELLQDAESQEETENIENIIDYVECEGDCYERFREYLWDNDDSGDLLKEVMNNTDEPGMFYDLNEWFGESWCWNNETFGVEIKRVCDALHLDFHDKKNRDMAYELLANATGGGYLRIYFNVPIWDMISGDKGGCKYGRSKNDKYDYKSIKFDGDFMVAIINPYEGSGMVEDDVRLNVALQFHRENLRISKSEKYSYEETFGAYSNYHTDTPDFSFNEPEVEVAANESIAAYNEQEKRYNETFKNGGCTNGDTDFKRHRNVNYKNIPPFAGWYCPHCGMYWAD